MTSEHERLSHLHSNVSRETLSRLEHYRDELLRWNQRINLISPSTESNIWTRHIEDAYQIVRLLPENTKTITDFGTGAGIPGIILAITTPAHVHLVESDAKKIAFLRHIKHTLSLNITLHHTRIESLEPWGNDVVTARALSPLPDLFTLLEGFLGKTHLSIFPKGKNSVKEIEETRINWKFEYDIHPSQIEPDANIIVSRHIRRK